MPNKGGPRPTRRQFVCPDPLWARVQAQVREERTTVSQWVREAIQARLSISDLTFTVRVHGDGLVVLHDKAGGAHPATPTEVQLLRALGAVGEFAKDHPGN